MKPDIRASIRRALLVVLVTYLPFLAIHALCLTGYGWTITGVELFSLVPLGALFGLPLALVCLPFKRLRAKAILFLITGVALLVLVIPVVKAADAVRRFGFRLAAERAVPLVAAIEHFERETGVPPHDLDELVPRYLTEVSRGLPPLQIVTGDRAKRLYQGNEWALVADVSTGLLNWDVFMYFPSRDYPDYGFGGSIERIADWAYVHE